MYNVDREAELDFTCNKGTPEKRKSDGITLQVETSYSSSIGKSPVEGC
ncbi:MAG: hypothetical protein QXX12_06055 [Nanopusillaceae archaeon]